MISSVFFNASSGPRLYQRYFSGASQPARRALCLPRSVAAITHEMELSPHATLTRFEREGAPSGRRILLVPPISGVFAFLLRDMVAELTASGVVDLIEWGNIRWAPAEAGRFDFDDQIETIMRALASDTEQAHLVGVCQSAAAALAAAAWAPSAVASVNMIGAPIATHAAPSVLSKTVKANSLDWWRSRFETRALENGGQRLVYPARAQLDALYTSLCAQTPMRDELARMMWRDEGFDAGIETIRANVAFIDLATSMMDVPAEHFISNLERIFFSDAPLPQRLNLRGDALRVEALNDKHIAAFEGALDQVVGAGQAQSALAELPARSSMLRKAHVIEGVGHFGLIYGHGWRNRTAPLLRAAFSSAEKLAELRGKIRKAVVRKTTLSKLSKHSLRSSVAPIPLSAAAQSLGSTTDWA